MSEKKRPEELSFKNAPIELKEEGDRRYLEAVFSLFDTIDSDQDVTKQGALRSGYNGNKVPLVWNHDWSKVIGRGIIETDNQKAVFKGYFLDTEAGKEAYNTVKAMSDMQQFSYGFQVMKSSKGTHIDSKGEEVPVRVLEDVKVWEVSPVLVGAQQNSFVQALKSGLINEDPEEEDIDDVDQEFEEVKEMVGQDEYTTQQEAAERAKEIGCEGTHTHEKEDGSMIYMPCATHNEYVNQKEKTYHRKKCNYDKDGKCRKEMKNDLEVSSNNSQQGKRLGEHAVSSLEEIKAFTERIEDLALLRNSEKKTLSSKSTELISKYLEGLNSTFNRLDDLLNSYGYDPVKDNELFIEVQKNLAKGE